jgi:hypothetical protein
MTTIEGWVTRSIRESWFEGLLFLPVVLIISKLILTATLLWAWLLSLFVLRALAVILMKRLRRRIWLALIGIVSAFVVPLVFSVPISAAVVLAALGAASFWRSVGITAAKQYRYSAGLYVVGLVSYVVYAALAVRVHVYLEALPFVTGLAVVSIVFILLEVNRSALADASFTQTETIDVDHKVRELNRVHVVTLLAVVIFISVLWRLLGVLPNVRIGLTLHPNAVPPILPHHSPALPPISKVHKSAFAQILSLVLEVGAILIVSVVGVWFAVRAGKLIVAGMTSLLTRLRERLHPQGALGYVDRVESLESPKLKERLALRRMRKSQSGVRWEALYDPREKARYLYRKIIEAAISKGFTWSKSDTPLEVSAELQAFVDDNEVCKDIPEFVHLYRIARYSEHPVDNEAVETAHLRLSKLLLLGRASKRRR